MLYFFKTPGPHEPVAKAEHSAIDVHLCKVAWSELGIMLCLLQHGNAIGKDRETEGHAKALYGETPTGRRGKCDEGAVLVIATVLRPRIMGILIGHRRGIAANQRTGLAVGIIVPRPTAKIVQTTVCLRQPEANAESGQRGQRALKSE